MAVSDAAVFAAAPDVAVVVAFANTAAVAYAFAAVTAAPAAGSCC